MKDYTIEPLDLLKKHLKGLEVHHRKVRDSNADGYKTTLIKLKKNYSISIAILESHPNFKNTTGAIVTGSGKNEL